MRCLSLIGVWLSEWNACTYIPQSTETRRRYSRRMICHQGTMQCPICRTCTLWPNCRSRTGYIHNCCQTINNTVNTYNYSKLYIFFRACTMLLYTFHKSCITNWALWKQLQTNAVLPKWWIFIPSYLKFIS